MATAVDFTQNQGKFNGGASTGGSVVNPQQQTWTQLFSYLKGLGSPSGTPGAGGSPKMIFTPAAQPDAGTPPAAGQPAAAAQGGFCKNILGGAGGAGGAG